MRTHLFYRLSLALFAMGISLPAQAGLSNYCDAFLVTILPNDESLKSFQRDHAKELRRIQGYRVMRAETHSALMSRMHPALEAFHLFWFGGAFIRDKETRALWHLSQRAEERKQMSPALYEKLALVERKIVERMQEWADENRTLLSQNTDIHQFLEKTEGISSKIREVAKSFDVMATTSDPFSFSVQFNDTLKAEARSTEARNEFVERLNKLSRALIASGELEFLPLISYLQGRSERLTHMTNIVEEYEDAAAVAIEIQELLDPKGE